MPKDRPKSSLRSDLNDVPGPGHAERISGMCSHGLISEERAMEVVERVKNGDQTIEAAIAELQENCSCGLFLPSRARRILNAASIKLG